MQEQGVPFNTYTKHFSDNDRAIVEGCTEGFVKIHCKAGTDEILGATIVGEGAGDMISEVSLAMSKKIGLGSIASVIHPYPTKAEVCVRLLHEEYALCIFTSWCCVMVDRRFDNAGICTTERASLRQ
jgi:pyruvate/2-oxoglutarate dehydrogenase complex dihydrolipoamide dehydrogenase (E3) component